MISENYIDILSKFGELFFINCTRKINRIYIIRLDKILHHIVNNELHLPVSSTKNIICFFIQNPIWYWYW